MTGMTRRIVLALLTSSLLAAACSGNGDATTSTPSTAASDATATFSAQVASSDLATSSPEEVQVGVFSSTAEEGVQLLSYGQVDVAFSYLGADGSDAPSAGPSTTADFVPAPGDAPLDAEGPTLTNPAEVAGVYVTPDISFPQSGIWNASVTASVDGGAPFALDAAFTVYADHRIPAPGDAALATKNHTIDSKGVPAVAIDSRAQDGAEVPDPGLHDSTIAEGLRQGRPMLVQFATPVYCQSQFCGPDVEWLEGFAAERPDDAAYIHVEVWNDYQAQAVNEAAAAWLYRDEELTEPWLFLIDAKGDIAARWGPLFDPAGVERELDRVLAG